MTRRPEIGTLAKNSTGWDNDYNKTLLHLGLNNFPIRLPVHIGDESDIATTFLANRFTHCILLVDDTSEGWSIYLSNGTTWNRLVALNNLVSPTPQTYKRRNLTQIQNGDINFVGIFEINNIVLGKYDLPINLPIHSGDETDLETLLPADNWQHCGILVYNTTLGASFYTSDGSTWKRQF